MVNLEIDSEELRPIVVQVVSEVLAQAKADECLLGGRLAYPEPEAAALLGVRPHVLRDARLRGEIDASKVGKRIVYTSDALHDFLRRNRWEQ